MGLSIERMHPDGLVMFLAVAEFRGCLASVIFPPEIKVRPTCARRASRSLNRVEFDDVRGSAVAYDSHGQRRSTAHHDDFFVREAISLNGTNVSAATASTGLGGGEPASRPANVSSRSLIRAGLPSIGIKEIMHTSSTDAASASLMSSCLRSSLV